MCLIPNNVERIRFVLVFDSSRFLGYTAQALKKILPDTLNFSIRDQDMVLQEYCKHQFLKLDTSFIPTRRLLLKQKWSLQVSTEGGQNENSPNPNIL